MEKQLVKFERDAGGNMTFAPFMANGKKYRFIKPGDSIGIEKYTHYQQLKIVVGAGVAFPDLISGLIGHKKLLAGDQAFADIRAEAIVWTDSVIKGLVDLSKSRYDKAFYLCSLFIFEDGKDPFEWSYDIAEEMIEDWKTEGIDEQDLFFFAALLLPGWRMILNGLQSEVDSEAERNLARSLVGTLLEARKSS